MSHQVPSLINRDDINYFNINVQPGDSIAVDIYMQSSGIHIQVRVNNVLTVCYEIYISGDGSITTTIFDLDNRMHTTD